MIVLKDDLTKIGRRSGETDEIGSQIKPKKLLSKVSLIAFLFRYQYFYTTLKYNAENLNVATLFLLDTNTEFRFSK
jgi:hypothetical protein